MGGTRTSLLGAAPPPGDRHGPTTWPQGLCFLDPAACKIWRLLLFFAETREVAAPETPTRPTGQPCSQVRSFDGRALTHLGRPMTAAATPFCYVHEPVILVASASQALDRTLSPPTPPWGGGGGPHVLLFCLSRLSTSTCCYCPARSSGPRRQRVCVSLDPTVTKWEEKNTQQNKHTEGWSRGLAGVALAHLLSAGRRDMFDSERSENICQDSRRPCKGTKGTVAQMSRRLACCREPAIC